MLHYFTILMNTSSKSYKSVIAFFWQFIRPHPWTFFFTFILSLVWALDATLWPFIFRKIIDIFTQYENLREAAFPAFKTPIIWALCLWLIIEYGFRAMGVLFARAIPRLESDIRMKMFDHIQYHSPKYFNEHFAGSLSNKITDMTTQASFIIQNLLIMFIPALTTCVMAITFFAFIKPIFALLIGLWIVNFIAVCLIFAKKCSTLETLHSEIRTSLLGKIVDSFSNNFAVNLFYRFSFEKRRIAITQAEEAKSNYKSKIMIEKMRFCIGIFSWTEAFLIYGFMLYYWMQGEITTGQAVQIFNTVWNVGMILWMTGTTLPAMYQSFGIAKQALSVMNDPQDIVDAPHAKPLIITKGEIIFEKVSFHYGERKLFQNKEVHIRGGEKVGLVGYSGAGKSTFVNLILRFYPVKTGRILIDGQNIADATLATLRQDVALIPQDPLLFHRSLKENIQYGRIDASEEEIVKAAKLAHCDEFIQNIPKGYDALVGERGTKLSGGERQRIAIARAILKNSPIIIFDEATSALDSVTESYIQDSLETLMQNRTTIVIAHRLSTLSKMDRILVFDQGKIVEDGSHDKLMALNGHYAKMWKTQAGGFLPETP